MVLGFGSGRLNRRLARHLGADWKLQQLLPLPSLGRKRPRGEGLFAHVDPAEGYTPLRHDPRSPAAIGFGDQNHVRCAQIFGTPFQLSRLRTRPRLAHVGIPQSRWHHPIPRGGP